MSFRSSDDLNIEDLGENRVIIGSLREQIDWNKISKKCGITYFRYSDSNIYGPGVN